MLIWILGLAGVIFALHLLVVMGLAEISVHPPILRRPCDTDGMALSVAKAVHATAELVQMQSADGVKLSAWWLQLPPESDKRNAVVVCHGVADTAFGVMSAALMYLRNGYSVLAPDNRGHGGSGGSVTYGVREAGDIAAWQKWMEGRGAENCYGFGESLGASALLQSLRAGADFRAIVAECAFSSFERVAWDRLSRFTGHFLPGRVAFWAADLWVKEMLFYIRLRYRVNLSSARPVDCVQDTHVPILLIHGTGDDETPAHHSTEIAAANDRCIQLWLVPGAKHTGALSVDPVGFEARIMALMA